MKKPFMIIMVAMFAIIFSTSCSYADAKADDYEDAPPFPFKTPYQRKPGDVGQEPLSSWKNITKSHLSIKHCMKLNNKLGERDECLRGFEEENMQRMEELTYYAMTLCDRRYDQPKACANQVMRVYKSLVDAHVIKADSTVAFYDDPDRFVYNAVDSANTVISFLIFIGGMQQTFPNSYKNDYMNN